MTSPPHPRPYLVADAAGLASRDERARSILVEDLDELGEITTLALAATPDASDRNAGSWADELRIHRDPTHDPIPAGWLAIREDDGRIASYVATRMWWGTPFISHPMTRPDRQRLGYGTALVRTAGAVALEAGHDRLGLIVTRTNPAIDLYRSLGFREEERPA